MDRGSAVATGPSLFTGIPRSAVHELRTPLTAIRGYAQLLLRGINNPELIQRAHQVIYRESLTLTRLLDQLSEAADVHQGTMRVRFERVGLDQLIETAVHDARAVWPEHRFEIRARGTLDLVCDPQLLRRCFDLLLENAARYSDPGTTIEVEAAREGNHICVSIADRGIGIPPEELETVFQCFSRGSNAGQASGGGGIGLGLGLYLARAAAERHGGRLWAQNRPGGGTILRLALPARPVDGKVAPQRP